MVHQLHWAALVAGKDEQVQGGGGGRRHGRHLAQPPPIVSGLHGEEATDGTRVAQMAREGEGGNLRPLHHEQPLAGGAQGQDRRGEGELQHKAAEGVVPDEHPSIRPLWAAALLVDDVWALIGITSVSVSASAHQGDEVGAVEEGAEADAAAAEDGPVKDSLHHQRLHVEDAKAGGEGGGEEAALGVHRHAVHHGDWHFFFLEFKIGNESQEVILRMMSNALEFR